MIQWIGLRENLQETMVFPLNMVFSCKFSLKPIHWMIVGASHGSYDGPYFGYQGLDPKPQDGRLLKVSMILAMITGMNLGWLWE